MNNSTPESTTRQALEKLRVLGLLIKDARVFLLWKKPIPRIALPVPGRARNYIFMTSRMRICLSMAPKPVIIWIMRQPVQSRKPKKTLARRATQMILTKNPQRLALRLIKHPHSPLTACHSGERGQAPRLSEVHGSRRRCNKPLEGGDYAYRHGLCSWDRKGQLQYWWLYGYGIATGTADVDGYHASLAVMSL